MKIKLLNILFLVVTISVFSQEKNVFWKSITNQNEKISNKNIEVPQKNLYNLDINALKDLLNTSPKKNSINTNKSLVIIYLPNADGELEKFSVYENSIMDPLLSEQYPEIKSYVGFGVDNPASSVYFSVSPLGFKSMTLNADRSSDFIEPYNKDLTIYSSYRKSDKKQDLSPFECKLIDQVQSKITNNSALRPNADDGKLRTFRLALSVTGEYTTFFGGTKANALAAMNNTMTRVNGIFEKDFGLRMILIANNDALIYTNASTDPYSPGDIGVAGSWTSELQNTINTVIGNSAYDVGHLFGASGGGGNAGCIACVCDTGKGSAYSSPSNAIPSGDTFDVDYVAHEFGHQFGAFHTYSFFDEGGTGAQMETGSGSTVMSYAGISGGNTDVQSNSDSYFHAVSIQQITDYIKLKTCPTITLTGNAIPTANAGLDYTIPKGTPFVLTGSATDANNDPLTYCWEQMNEGGPTTSFPSATATTGPAFRSNLPSTFNNRYFPQLATILSGATSTKWEVVPTVARTMNFRMTVRDNRAGGSANNSDDMVVNVNGTAGPFVVTSPNTAVSYVGGSSQNITWNVAGTTTNGVNCANVDILLSRDSGGSYIVLVAQTPNDGSQALIIPNTPGNTNRIMVRGSNHIFLDISNVNFTITSGTSGSNIPTLINPAAGVSIASPINFTWSTTVSGASCRIQVSKVNTGWTAANGFTTDATANSNTPVNYSAGGLLNYQWPNQFTAPENKPVAGNTYYWTVRSFSTATGTSSYSPVRSFTVSSTSRIIESTNDTDFVVYPNPSNGEITINFNSDSQKTTLSLFDLLGKQIFEKNYQTQKGNNTLKENITGLKTGNYILLLNDGKKIIRQNIKIQNK